MFNIHNISQNPCTVQFHLKEKTTNIKGLIKIVKKRLKATTDSRVSHIPLAFMLTRNQTKYELDGTSPFQPQRTVPSKMLAYSKFNGPF